MTSAAAESIGLSAVMLSKLEFLLKFAVAASTSNGPVGVKAPPPKNVNARLTISLELTANARRIGSWPPSSSFMAASDHSVPRPNIFQPSTDRRAFASLCALLCSVENR